MPTLKSIRCELYSESRNEVRKYGLGVRKQIEKDYRLINRIVLDEDYRFRVCLECRLGVRSQVL